MRWFDTLRIRGKLLALSGALALLTVLLGTFAISRLAKLRGTTMALADDVLPGTDAAAALRAQVLELRLAQYRTITESTAEGRASALATVRQEMAEIEAAAKRYEPMIDHPTERGHFTMFRRKFDAYMADWREIETMVSSGARDDVAARMVSVSDPLHVAMDSSLAAMIVFNRDAGTAAGLTSQAVFARARLEIVLGVLVAAVLAAVLSTLIATRMTASLREMARVATSLQSNCIAGVRRALVALADGDMSVEVKAVTTPINSTAADEIGDVARTCDRMLLDVQAVVAAVSQTQHRVNAMVADALSLVDAARAGALETRVDHLSYGGSFRTLVGGLNDTLAAVATPMREVNAVLARVADRDLTQHIEGQYRGTFATVASGVNTAIDSLNDTLAQVSTASAEVAYATREITTSAQVLASGASEQAASLEEISASVHVFAAMTHDSAQRAAEASTLASSAHDEAHDGASRMGRLTQAVQEIRDASSETAKILRTIDEIAFQTNLLALNAAVEAARAGDAGRGFAVVAEEVRSLALRAADAAKSTALLIDRGQDAALRGVALNTEVLQSFERITERIKRVSAVTAAITTSGRQQEEGVAQIKSAVDQINMVTQQVAAGAEESAGAATELSGQSESLRRTVERFTLAGPPRVADHRTTHALTPPTLRRGRAARAFSTSDDGARTSF